MKMVKGFESMLAGSLDLEEPWYITGAEFDPVKNVIDVYVGIREDAVIACPRCGGPTKRYGYEPIERSWRHADCLFYPCYVHCKRPRVKAIPHKERTAKRSEKRYNKEVKKQLTMSLINDELGAGINEEKQRDPEAHSVKKGNQWYFGYKEHIGVDADSGLVHTVETTAAILY